MIRLIRDSSAEIERAPPLTILFDGQPIGAHEGETVAVALLRAGHLMVRQAPNDRAPRGLFCCMGLCQECAIIVDGNVTEACRQIVSDGMAITSLPGAS